MHLQEIIRISYNFLLNNIFAILLSILFLILQMFFSIKTYGDITTNLVDTPHNNYNEIQKIIKNIDEILANYNDSKNENRILTASVSSQVNNISLQEENSIKTKKTQLLSNNSLKNKFQFHFQELCKNSSYKNLNTKQNVKLIQNNNLNSNFSDKTKSYLDHNTDRFIYYEIKSGDTLEQISYKFYKTNKMVVHLVRLNKIQDYHALKPGMILKLPKVTKVN